MSAIHQLSFLSTALFPLGQVCATPGALDVLAAANLSPADFLARHCAGDWGDLCDEDRAANDQAVLHGGRLLSSYCVGTGLNGKVWIITEWDRSVTTVLRPEDY